MRHCIPTFSGEAFDPFDPDPSKIHITDIAHQLAALNRWNGATNWSATSPPISVAEHSVRVANQCPRVYRLDGLLHDAAEAYLGDIPRPYKWRLVLLVAAEERLRRVIAEKYGALSDIPPEVVLADDRMQVTEFRDLIDTHSDGWRETLPDAEPFAETIRTVSPFDAEVAFLKMFETLTRGRR